MDWVSEKMYILGVNIPLKTDPRKLMDWNLLSKLKDIKSTFNKWKKILLYMVRMLLSKVLEARPSHI